jgi:hypothetical protein
LREDDCTIAHETRTAKPGYQLAVGICSVFKACNSGAEYSKDIMPEDKAAALIGYMRQCKGRSFATLVTPQGKSKL